MKNRTTLAFGFALLAAALLAACGGGSQSTPPIVGSPGGPGATTPTSETAIKIQIPVGLPKKRPHAARRRNYVSMNAMGLQISVSATGAPTKTFYADISSTSPLCVYPSPLPVQSTMSEATCTITVPTLAASETINALEVDTTPTGENVSTGLGTGFTTTSNILGVGSGTAVATAGTSTTWVALNPVVKTLFDCPYATSYINNPSLQNFGDDTTGSPRLVVTAGLAAVGQFGVEFFDAAMGWYFALPSPLPAGLVPSPQPFVDVNGSSTPITITSNNANITLYALSSPSPAASPFAVTTSMPDNRYYLYNCIFLIDVNTSAALTAPAPGATPPTITFANNLTASLPAPYVTSAPGNYGSTLVYVVAPVAVTPNTANVAVTGSVTATVTGSDYGATSGMGAESAYAANDGNCKDTTTTSQVDATVVGAAINTTTWQQVFTITPVHAGTCQFILYDIDTNVVTTTVTPVTVTVGP